MTFHENAFEAYALEAAREYKIPGLAVAAGRDGVTIYAHGFGTDQYVRFLMDHSGRARAVAYGLRIIARTGSSEPHRSAVEDRAGRPV